MAATFDHRLLCGILQSCDISRRWIISQKSPTKSPIIEVFKLVPKSSIQAKLDSIYSPTLQPPYPQAPSFWLVVPVYISKDNLRKQMIRWVYPEDIPKDQNGQPDASWRFSESQLLNLPTIPKFDPARPGVRLIGHEDFLLSLFEYIQEKYKRQQSKTKLWERHLLYARAYSKIWKDFDSQQPQSKDFVPKFCPNVEYPVSEQDKRNLDRELPVLKWIEQVEPQVGPQVEPAELAAIQVSFNLEPLCEILKMCNITFRRVRCRTVTYDMLEVFKITPVDYQQVQRELFLIYYNTGLFPAAPSYWLILPRSIENNIGRSALIRWVYPEDEPKDERGNPASRWTKEHLDSIIGAPRINTERPGITLFCKNYEKLLVKFFEHLSDRNSDWNSHLNYARIMANYWNVMSATYEYLSPYGPYENYPRVRYPMFYESHQDIYEEIRVRGPDLPEEEPQDPEVEPQDQEVQQERRQERVRVGPEATIFAPNRTFRTWGTLPTVEQGTSPPNDEDTRLAQAQARLGQPIQPRSILKSVAVYLSATKKLVTGCKIEALLHPATTGMLNKLTIYFKPKYRISEPLAKSMGNKLQPKRPQRRRPQGPAPIQGVVMASKAVASRIELTPQQIDYVAIVSEHEVAIAFKGAQRQQLKLVLLTTHLSLKNFTKLYLIDKCCSLPNYQMLKERQESLQIDKAPTVTYYYKQSAGLEIIKDDRLNNYKRTVFQVAHAVLGTLREVAPADPQDQSNKVQLFRKVVDKYLELRGLEVDRRFPYWDDPYYVMHPPINIISPDDTSMPLPINIPLSGSVEDLDCEVYVATKNRWIPIIKVTLTPDESTINVVYKAVAPYWPQDKANIKAHPPRDISERNTTITIYRKRMLYWKELFINEHDFYSISIHCLSEYFHFRCKTLEQYRKFRCAFLTTIGLTCPPPDELNFARFFTLDMEPLSLHECVKLWEIRREFGSRPPNFIAYGTIKRNQGESRLKLGTLISHDLKHTTCRVLDRIAFKIAYNKFYTKDAVMDVANINLNRRYLNWWMDNYDRMEHWFRVVEPAECRQETATNPVGRQVWTKAIQQVLTAHPGWEGRDELIESRARGKIAFTKLLMDARLNHGAFSDPDI